MILYKAIKYKILEFCLDSFLKKIASNIFSDRFDVLSPGQLTPGMTFSRMEIGEEGFHSFWTDVRITGIQSLSYQDYISYKIIFYFSETNFIRKTSDEPGEEIIQCSDEDLFRVTR